MEEEMIETPIRNAREALEAAAQHHERHADSYARIGAHMDEAAHRAHAAAIRALSARIPPADDEALARKMRHAAMRELGHSDGPLAPMRAALAALRKEGVL
jgi:hypothetical protein